MANHTSATLPADPRRYWHPPRSSQTPRTASSSLTSAFSTPDGYQDAFITSKRRHDAFPASHHSRSSALIRSRSHKHAAAAPPFESHSQKSA
jgi:hypothetical protein